MKKMKNISKFANRIENASMAELVDALDSKSSVLGRAGSIPARGTFINLSGLIHKLLRFLFFIISQ